MALWEFACEKCGKTMEMLTSELTHEQQETKAGELVVGLEECECGSTRYRRVPTAAARTPDRWR